MQQAVLFARQRLAPLALDSFPEAYEQFKETMLLLAYPPPNTPPKSDLERAWYKFTG